MSILKKAHPRVDEFITALRANVLTLDEYDALIGGMSKNNRAIANANAAFYNASRDAVVINPNTKNGISIIDRTLLHEIGHWSGHSTRMRRKVIVNTEKRIGYEEIDLENEEIAAEMICCQLGVELGILTSDWKRRSENYIATYTKGSIYDVKEDVERAVWLLLKIATANMKEIEKEKNF